MNRPAFQTSTSPQNPREVLEGFRGIQRNALTIPLKGRLAVIRAALDNEKRNRMFFRTSEGFQAAYSVKITSSGCFHSISAKSKKLPLDAQVEAVLFILLELNRQFGQAGIESLQLSAGNIRRSLFGTLFVEFSLQPSQ